MRLKRQNIKKWFNSYLTFQHLKANSSRNLVNSDDRDNMWLPIYDEVNAQDKTKIVLFREEEIFKIIPQANFNFILNSKSDHNNARLFKVLLHELKSYYQAHIHRYPFWVHSKSIDDFQLLCKGSHKNCKNQSRKTLKMHPVSAVQSH